MMWWILKSLSQRLNTTDGGVQTAWFLWLVPSYPWGGGGVFVSPQDDPQSVKVDGSYLYDGRFCPDISFCDVFTLPIIKDTLAYKGLDIDCELRKGNVRASSMHIGVSSTKTIETVCKEDECITAFEASFILPIEGGHIKTRV